MQETIWHRKEIEEVYLAAGSTPQGISQQEAARRLERQGPNELIEKKRKSPFMMFIDQFKDFMILVLMVAAVISGFIGELSDTIAIAVILILNAVIGFIQEYRAEKAMEALQKMAGASATVIRSGIPSTIPAREVVIGDIVLLEAGKIVPADMRVVESANLRVEEAALTGESVPVEKHADPALNEALPLGDRKNMAYRGTFATYGRARCVVTATGMDTELGKIAGMLQDQEEIKTPLQKRLAVFGRKLAVAVLIICAVVFLSGILRGEDPLLMLLTAISLAVAAIPEALPAVITISLALGAKRMVAQNALVRKLPAVETLGSVTFICSDKTGTLTMNRMSVDEMYADGTLIQSADVRAGDVIGRHISQSVVWRHLMSALALSNDAQPDQDNHLIGDPTEIALYDIAARHGFDKKDLEAVFPRVAEIPFDSERKCMSTVHKRLSTDVEESPPYISFTKGAMDVLLPKVTGMLTTDGLQRIQADEIERINDAMASDGMRVLCLCMKHWDAPPKPLTPEVAESGLILLGLAGLLDLPREEAREAIDICKAAGIQPVMITGDHPLTAMSIARRIGVMDDHPNAVMTGRELEALSMEAFEQKAEHIRVYARVAPEQKLKIVKALQDKGQFVAMTGDGINDAPALKSADIGVAMGITGTDVSKEAADMILLDDNFATILKAVREGRKIYDNIRKFVKYLMTSNSAEIWTLFLAPFLGLPIPLLPIHILWINLATDGLPALALSMEPAEEGIMKRPPRHPKESIFAHGLGIHAVWVGLLMGGITLGCQAWSIHVGDAHWQTMVFTVLCLAQLGHVMAIRSETQSLFKQGIMSNRFLFFSVVFTLIMQLATIYVPFLNPIFKTQPLTTTELGITLALSCVIFVVVEIEKFVKRRLLKQRS